MNDIYLQLYLQNHINVHIYLYLYGFVSVNALGEIVYRQVKCKCKRLATVHHEGWMIMVRKQFSVGFQFPS